jgi:hypothetical protein
VSRNLSLALGLAFMAGLAVAAKTIGIIPAITLLALAAPAVIFYLLIRVSMS